MKALLTAALMLLPAAGFAASDEIVHKRYACEKNEVLDVVFVNTAAGNNYAVMLQMDELIPMEITPMASGASYKAISPDYTYVLNTKGDTAELTEGADKVILADCKAS